MNLKESLRKFIETYHDYGLYQDRGTYLSVGPEATAKGNAKQSIWKEPGKNKRPAEHKSGRRIPTIPSYSMGRMGYRRNK